MIEAELIVSNLSGIQEHAGAVSTYWNASHHSQNFRDTLAAAKETFASTSKLGKAAMIPFAIGLTALEFYELSWMNENRTANIATREFVESGGQALLEPAVEVAKFTGPLEMGLALGAVAALHVMRPAVDVVRQRYYATEIASAQIENEAEKQKRGLLRPILKAGKIWLLALGTGAFGVTAIEDASSEKYSATKNVVKGAAAAGALVLSNMGIVAGVLWGIKTGTPYISDGLMNFAEGVKEPVVIGSALGGGMVYKSSKEKKRIKRKWAEEGRFQETEAVVDDQTIEATVI